MPNILKIFNRQFDLSESLEQEKVAFVNRINQTIFSEIEEGYNYGKIFRHLCYWLGINADDRISALNKYTYSDDRMPFLRSLTGDEFAPTLKALILLYQFYDNKNEYSYEQNLDNIDRWINTALDNANLDLGIRWKQGMFYQSGADILDEKLIEEPLGWIGSFPEVKEDYKKALSGLLKKDYPGVIDHCYLSFEGLVRSLLKNSKTLNNNKQELLKKLELSQQWKSFLDKFTDYANEFKRHASKNRDKIKPQEVEAFLYLTGLLIRLTISLK